MTLRTRMIGAAAGLIFSLLLMIGLSLWVVTELAQQHARTFEEYAELRLIERVSLEMAKTRGLLDNERPDPRAVHASIGSALDSLQQFVALQEHSREGSAEHQEGELTSVHDIVAALRSLMVQIRNDPDLTTPADRRAMIAAADDLLASLTALDTQTNYGATESHNRAIALTRRAMVWLSIGGVAIALAGIMLSLAQYRSVIRPLRRLRYRARQIASGDLTARVDERGDREFAELARDFNAMTTELETLYRDLNRRVEVKSRQLVRSERLASVGYLAAGVAHEINNPLSIIAGHAEMTLNRLRKRPVENSDPDLAESLQIVMEEAFRCKQITNKLLSLTRQETSAPQPIDLRQIAADVQAMVAGLKQFRDRTVETVFTDSQPLTVLAREPEMKQVLLNLTVNSLEATAPAEGRVMIQGVKRDDFIRMSVIDNGRGMSSDEIEHVFEPFFTQKRSASERGTGLGLSIVHAIVEDHGGHIDAFSEGVGHGSRFTIEIPAYSDEVCHATTASQS